jgi:hypothetical protein
VKQFTHPTTSLSSATWYASRIAASFAVNGESSFSQSAYQISFPETVCPDTPTRLDYAGAGALPVRRDTPNESPASKNGNLLGKLSATRQLPETKGVRLIQLRMWTGEKPWIW